MRHEQFPGLDAASEPAWQGERVLDDRVVPVAVWLLGAGDVAPAQLARAAAFLGDLEGYDARARALLAADSDVAGSETSTYCLHHIEELDSEELEAVFGGGAPDVDVRTFCRALRLVRVGIHPARDRAVFDYSIGTDMTDYVLAVTIPADGGAPTIAMES